MTIKQQGGIFGRNPTFNDVTVKGSLAVDGGTSIAGDTGVTGTFTAKYLDVFSGVLSEEYQARIGYTDQFCWTLGRENATTGDFYIKNVTSGTPTEIARFSSTGLKFPNGKGIDFSATSGTGTSELFDGYEEGTWTPTYVPASGSFSSVTYDPNTGGRYTKVGNTVYISGSLRTDAISVGSASGQVFIGGLPFSVGAYNYDGGGLTVFQSNLFTGEEPASASPVASGTTAALLYRTAADGPLTSETQVGDLGTGANNNILRFFGFYFV